ncbi:MAG: RHS repeat-associated core domain-containing protein [Phycisphaerales bacterium]|nr:RHS repeat-associated core domain-containing protein [Phycisphaerales bacterium]
MYDTNGTTTGQNPEADDMAYAYLYNANGDVGQVVDPNAASAAASLVARYEYDPYGNRINTPAPGEYEQPFQFSTKQWDPETGLLYFGLRYRDRERWISRDPVGEPGFEIVQGRAPLRHHGGRDESRNVGHTALRTTHGASGFIPRGRQHVPGGANRYSYVLNGPTNAVDPLGLDRYIVSDGGMHTGICVDTWDKVGPKVCCTAGPHRGKWMRCFVPTGTVCFDFRTHVSSPWAIINFLPSIVVGAGDVKENGPIGGRTVAVTIASRCKEDKRLLDHLRDQVANPPLYSLLFYNCNRWTEAKYNVGIDNTVPASPCGCDVDCQ